MPGGAGQLAQESALGAAVALPERVQGVDLRQQRGEAVDEAVSRTAAQVTGAGQPGEHVVGPGAQLVGQAEQRTLADRDGAQLAGPVVDLAENEPVKRLQVGQVVLAGQRSRRQLSDPDG